MLHKKKLGTSTEHVHNQTKTIIICLLLLVILTSGIGIKLGMNWQKAAIRKKEHHTQITSDVLRQQITELGELATTKYYYTNMGKYEHTLTVWDHDVPFTTKSFVISYDGIIKAGIDIADVGIYVADSTVTVTLPEVQVLSHEVDMDSVIVYDEKSSIFNGLSTDDITSFLSEQKSLMEEKSINSGFLEETREQAKKTLAVFMQRMISDLSNEMEYKLEIN